MVRNWGKTNLEHKSRIEVSKLLDIMDSLLLTRLCYPQIVIIPNSERRGVLKICHDNEIAGHLGITKTLARIRQRTKIRVPLVTVHCNPCTTAYIADYSVCLCREIHGHFV